jgi:uncharacterized protein (TIGR03084 family)
MMTPDNSVPITPTQADNSKKQLVAELAADLRDETRELTAVLDGLRDSDWDAATPAAGWSVRDQVTHLAYFDDAAALSLRDPGAFRRQVGKEITEDGAAFPDKVAERHRHMTGPECRAWFARSRDALLTAYLGADPSARLPWYGPEMGIPSSITARLMETWAHGQDIRDALGIATQPSVRLRHIANLGVRTLGFSFVQRGLTAPEEPVGVSLTGPGGESWTWGPSGAANSVSGDALDFCLVVTQRRNVADTKLRVRGDDARRWIDIAQAFAGQPTDPRPAGMFR